MLAVYKRVEKENEAEIGELFEKENFKQKENKIFTYIALSLEGSLSRDSLEKESFSDKEGIWEDNPDSLPACRSS